MTSINPWSRALYLFTLFIMLFTAMRAVLLFTQWDQFSDLSGMDMLKGFFYGIRFDISTITLSMGIPLLMTLLPYQWAHNVRWQAFWYWIIFALGASLILTLISDLVYFDFVQRHIGAEITLALDDTALMFDMLFSDYKWAVLLFLLLTYFSARLWRKLIPAQTANPLNARIGTLAVIASLAFCVILVRGGLQYKPLNIGDAFANSTSAEQGYLILNGAFAFHHSISGPKASARKFMPQDEAIEIVRSHFDDKQAFSGDDLPLVRISSFEMEKPRPTNVVILLLESFDSEHIDAIRELRGKKPLGLTPNFDRYAEQGLLFPNFYANGRRSIEGLAAILASTPSLPTLPYLGKGMEQSRLPFIGQLARHQGYSTIFMQSSKRNSFHVDAIAAAAGFTYYLGAEDIPADPQFEFENESGWGVWDHYTLLEAQKQFAALPQPFMGMIFTSTTHNPFRIPDEQWRIKSGDNNHQRYMNTIHYADWAVGRLLESAQQAGWFENTLWIVTADHVGPFSYTKADSQSRYRIPLLLIGPGIKSGVSDKLGSQVDILPTVIDYLQWNTAYSGYGQSLLSPKSNRYVFAVNDKLVDYFSDDAMITHDLNHTIANHVFQNSPDTNRMEKHLLAIYQTANQLILKNNYFGDD